MTQSDYCNIKPTGRDNEGWATPAEAERLDSSARFSREARLDGYGGGLQNRCQNLQAFERAINDGMRGDVENIAKLALPENHKMDQGSAASAFEIATNHLGYQMRINGQPDSNSIALWNRNGGMALQIKHDGSSEQVQIAHVNAQGQIDSAFASTSDQDPTHPLAQVRKEFANHLWFDGLTK